MAKKHNNNISIYEKHKEYEKIYENIIEPEKHIIIRIDGHHFSNYTKEFEKPFDESISNAMIETTKQLMERFEATFSYTQSDEITLFIPSLKDVTIDNREKKTHKLQKRIKKDWEHIFNGRTQKISSLASAFTTMCFNNNLTKNLKLEAITTENEKRKENLFKLMNSQKLYNAYFDARTYGINNNVEIIEAFELRMKDCEKNSVSMFSRTFCSQNELNGKSSEEQIEYCISKKNKNWTEIENKYKYGTFIILNNSNKDSKFNVININYNELNKYI